MKKIFLIASIGVLFACNRDENNADTPSISVTGKWKPTQFLIISGKDTKPTLYSETNSGCETSNRFEYKSDGTFSFSYYNTSTGVCALNNTFTGTYTYDSTNKKITTVSNSVSVISDVYSLTNSELQIKTQEADYNSDGTLDYYITVYTKQ